MCTRGARMFACWCTCARVWTCVSAACTDGATVLLEPTQRKEREARRGEGLQPAGRLLTDQTPQRPLAPAQGCPGPWGSEGCAGASEALGWTGRRTALLTACAVQDPSQQPTSGPPGAHVGRVNTRSRVAPRPGHRRGQLGVSSGHTASWLRDLGQCWQLGCAAFPGFLQGRDETSSKSQCPRAGPAGPAPLSPLLLPGPRLPPSAQMRTHTCMHLHALSHTVGHTLRRQATRHPVGKQTM